MNKHSEHTYSFDQLQAYVDGSLPEAQAREIGAHIDSCAVCRATVGKLRALEALAAQSEIVAAPDKYFDTFGSRVASRIAARAPEQRRARLRVPLWGLVPLAAAAGLVLVIALRPEQPATRIEPVAPVAPVAQSSPVPAKDSPVPGDERKAESTASDKLVLAASGAAPATELRAKKAAPSPAELAAPVGAIARRDQDRVRTPSRAESSKDSRTRPSGGIPLGAAPTGGAPVRVIVIHLPDGSSYCPAPEIATAIEITLPPGGAAVN